MGDRWVSPPKYSSTLQAGNKATVEARVYGRDSKGISVQISPEWIASDPDMVEVSSAQGGVVTITVKRAWQSRLNVVSQGFTKKLQVDATVTGNGMQVVISK